MKKRKMLSVGVVACIMMVSVLCWGFQPPEWVVKSSELTSSGSVTAVPGYLYGYLVKTDGSSPVLVQIYDTSATQRDYAASNGSAMMPLWTVTTSAANRMSSVNFDPPVAYSSGVFASFTTAGSAGLMFYYRER